MTEEEIKRICKRADYEKYRLWYQNYHRERYLKNRDVILKRSNDRYKKIKNGLV